MKIQQLNNFETIGESKWNDLLITSGITLPFMRYGYQHAWWSHLGGGEWKNAELKIFTADEDGQFIGIAPLFIGEKDNIKEIHFVGSLEISDYLDFIVSPAQSETFIRGILDLIVKEQEQFPRKIILFNLPENSPTLSVLTAIGAESDWKTKIEQAYHTPVIPLADDWDTYLASIDKKQRHEIRRKIRRAENAEEDIVAWHIVNNNESLDKPIEDFMQLMSNDPDKDRFLTDKMRTQMDVIMRWAAEENILQLSFLTVNGKNAAAYFCFDYANKIWVYNSGFSPDFRYYSPGWVLLSYLIQHAISGKRTHFDFMRGDEGYKYRFGAVDSFVMKAIITQ